MAAIPSAFRNRIALVHGDPGRAWIDRLPTLLGELERAWRIRIDPPFPELSYNYVAPATDAEGRPWMLKLTVPGAGEGAWEAMAMRAYDGRGASRGARSDPERHATLDPKGLVGEKAFDVPFFLLNPGPVPSETTRARIDVFVERLGLDRERVVAWSFVQAVASACWTIEDGGTDWQGGFGFAEGLGGL